MDRYATPDAGADATGAADASAAFTLGLSAARTLDVLPGAYKLSALPTFAGGVPFFHPGVSVTGTYAGAFGTSSGARYWGWINPDSQSDNGTFYWHLPGHLSQRRMSKIVSGAPQGSGSDQHYAADFTLYSDDIVQRNAANWYVVNAVNRWDVLARGINTPIRGTGAAQFAEVYTGDTAQGGSVASGESEGFNHTVIAIPSRSNAGHNWWGGEINVMGSAAGSSRMIVGQSVTVANPAPTQSRDIPTDYRGVVGQSIVTAPGSGVLPYRYGASWAGLTTHPLDRGMTIGGLTGAYDGPNPVMTGNESFADYGMLVGLDIGGNYTPWPYQRPGSPNSGYWQSKIKEGQYIQRYTDTGLRIFNPHPSGGVGLRSLKIDPGAGVAEFDSDVLFGAEVKIRRSNPALILQDVDVFSRQSRFALIMQHGLVFLQIQDSKGTPLKDVLYIDADGSRISFVASLIEAKSKPPRSAKSPCVVGQRAWDESFEYRCVAANKWRKAALADW